MVEKPPLPAAVGTRTGLNHTPYPASGPTWGARTGSSHPPMAGGIENLKSFTLTPSHEPLSYFRVFHRSSHALSSPQSPRRPGLPRPRTLHFSIPIATLNGHNVTATQLIRHNAAKTRVPALYALRHLGDNGIWAKTRV